MDTAPHQAAQPSMIDRIGELTAEASALSTDPSLRTPTRTAAYLLTKAFLLADIAAGYHPTDLSPSATDARHAAGQARTHALDSLTRLDNTP